jgi:hypothetical protein
MAIMIAAADHGIGTGHSSIGDQAKAREVLGEPLLERADARQLAHRHALALADPKRPTARLRCRPKCCCEPRR